MLLGVASNAEFFNIYPNLPSAPLIWAGKTDRLPGASATELLVAVA